MRILLLSDSHGYLEELYWTVEQTWKQTGPIDAYIHCGDGARDLDRISFAVRERDPSAVFYSVRGNCDFSPEYPDKLILPFGGISFLITHGHFYHVKSTLALLERQAADSGCRVALFGHTHSPLWDMKKVMLINPGAAMNGKAALIETDNGRVNGRLLEF